ncbi:MAG: ATP-dependent DNA helicase [Chloroflexota bacterium]
MTEQPSVNKGLQVAGQHGAATTEGRYGKDFLLSMIAAKRGQPYRAPRDEGPDETDDYYEQPEEEQAPAPPSMRDVLGPGGVVAQSLPGYEAREPQLLMAEAVAAAIDSGQHCLVEAGTGTGKSLAYLVPAIYAGKKTVVSTAVKSLQEQLWRKDVPFLHAVLPRPFSAALLKGRGNYLCLQRWDEEVGEQEMFGASYEYAEVKGWLETTESGDLEELPFSLSPELHGKVTATSDQCLGRQCPSFGSCYYEAAHARAELADLIIVNHTLLTLDCAIRQNSDGFAKVIPDRALVIVDEAHRLEEAATKAFETEISAVAIARLLHDKQVTAAGLDPRRLAEVQDAAEAFFETLARQNASQSFALGEPPRALQLQAEALALRLMDVKRELERRNPFAAAGGPQVEAFARFVGRVEEYARTVGNVLFPLEGQICYVVKDVSRRGKTIVYLRKCPICVAESLKAALWEEWPVVATSATLATGKGFDFFKSRCGCDEARELVVDSPFDYRRHALIYLPPAGALFDPTRYYQTGSLEYFDRLGEQIEQLLLASDGRAFCLFTSRKALEEIYGRLADRLRWLVLKQGDAPRPELLRQFKDDGHAVLFGLKSFWEGIDVQGEALSLVVIDKLPFNAPDDPIYQARCDEITKRTGDQWAWFRGLALPSAIITYKQGFGRLIRTRTDFGVVALLDGRITTKNYGTSVLRSLPPAAQTRSLEAVKMFFATRQVVDPQQGTLL